MNKATDPTALLESALIDALGAECLLGEDAKTLFSTDVYGGEIAPALVLRPQATVFRTPSQQYPSAGGAGSDVA